MVEPPGAVLAFGLGPRYRDGGEPPAPEELPGTPRALRWCEQVHGTLLASLASEPGRPLAGAAAVGRCDGLLTAEPGLGLAVRTADCVPVLLAGGGVVGAVHAGWRGTAAGIVARAVRRFAVEYGVAPGELHAALGPAIGGCCYEVGEEVIAALAGRGVPEALWRDGSRADLRVLLRAELVALGVPERRIVLAGGCTACTAELASYRRDGEAAGRQLSIAVLRAPRPLS